ncbi:hypothetical protein [Bacillus glycinifermentans]|nr:hypothetical protein [Bacillus glycinifermentans]
MIDTVMKLSAIIATWLGIIKLGLELRKMRKESESKERRSPTTKNRRRT